MTKYLLILALFIATGSAGYAQDSTQVRIKEEIKVLKEQMRTTRTQLKEETRKLTRLNRDLDKAKKQALKEKEAARKAKAKAKAMGIKDGKPKMMVSEELSRLHDGKPIKTETNKKDEEKVKEVKKEKWVDLQITEHLKLQ